MVENFHVENSQQIFFNLSLYFKYYLRCFAYVCLNDTEKIYNISTYIFFYLNTNIAIT